MSKALRKLPTVLTTQSTAKPARLWSHLPGGRVRCHLSPRECNIPDGGVGFCGVRRNIGGELLTLNYGKSVAITQETIETEAVYHYAPGARILSLGNVGCMMACDFCHNWQTSQAREARDQDIHLYTSEEIVEYAVRHGIRVLSWTYNDPVVWHEFVLDTARLARQHGLINLYKSAFYIGPKAVDELLEVIDIFSLSLKSMDPEFYRKHTRGRLQPVLDAIEQVYAATGGDGPHLELSNLCVTGRNDTLKESLKTAHWMLERLDCDVPLHYVRFHPDYKYTHVGRTSIPFLERAREAAIAAGLRNVYVGNVYGTDGANTRCSCGTLLVERFGPSSVSHLRDGSCPSCAKPADIARPDFAEGSRIAPVPDSSEVATQLFHGDIQALHIEQPHEVLLSYQFIDANGDSVGEPQSSSCTRFLISRSHAERQESVFAIRLASGRTSSKSLTEHTFQLRPSQETVHEPRIEAPRPKTGCPNRLSGAPP